MKPKIGRTIYYLCETQIIIATVYALGKNDFITDDILNPCVKRHFCIHDYNLYGLTWFTKISEAKKHLLDTSPLYDGKRAKRVVKVTDEFYELVY